MRACDVGGPASPAPHPPIPFLVRWPSSGGSVNGALKNTVTHSIEIHVPSFPLVIPNFNHFRSVVYTLLGVLVVYVQCTKHYGNEFSQFRRVVYSYIIIVRPIYAVSISIRFNKQFY